MKSVFSAFNWIKCTLGLALAVSGLFAQQANAALILNPGTVYSTSYNRGGENGFNSLNNLTNQGGLSKPYTSGVTVLASYLAAPAPTHLQSYASGNIWLTGGNTVTVVYDLGQFQTLGGVMWFEITASGHGGRTPKNVRFDISMDPTFATFTNMSTSTFPLDPGVLGVVHTLDFTRTAGGRYVRFNVDSTYSQEGNIQMAEMAFYTGVPEPTSMGLLGLGGMALLRRRRAR